MTYRGDSFPDCPKAFPQFVILLKTRTSSLGFNWKFKNIVTAHTQNRQTGSKKTLLPNCPLRNSLVQTMEKPQCFFPDNPQALMQFESPYK